MKVYLLLCLQEARLLRVSVATYVAAFLGLLLMAFLYFNSLLEVARAPSDQTPTELFFSTFWVPALLLVPMLTMRTLAEERRQGTLETLFVTPAGPLAVVLAKFTTTFAFYLLVWIIALAFPLLTTILVPTAALEGQLLDPANWWGGGLFVAATGALFISFGVFTSSLTRSQLVAGMLCFMGLFALIIGLAALRLMGVDDLLGWEVSVQTLEYFQLLTHFEDFVRGVVDTRPLVYYASGTALFLGLAVRSLEGRS